MTTTPRILALAGSVRKESFNKRLLRILVTGAQEAGADVTVLDLKEFPLPLFDQDLEATDGAPENVFKLKRLFIDHPGFLIASPEYNSSITPLLKNTIDWVSRPAPGETPLQAFQGKIATLVSASPGALGGLRALVHLRSILGNIGVIILPSQIAVSKASDAFNEDGSLKDAMMHESVKDLGRKHVETVRKLVS